MFEKLNPVLSNLSTRQKTSAVCWKMSVWTLVGSSCPMSFLSMRFLDSKAFERSLGLFSLILLFAVFSLSSTDDGQFFAFSAFHPRMMSAFWQIFTFIRGWWVLFAVFSLSSTDDSRFFASFSFSSTDNERFLANSTFRRPTAGCFYRFSRFGAPRRPVFQIFRASGLPESLFFEILRLRDSPTVHFHKKQLVGTSRNIVFPNFTLSGCPEA